MFPKGTKKEASNSQEDVSTEDKKAEEVQLKKTKRSREDVKELFKKNYIEKHGIDLSDPKIVEAGLDKKLDKVLDGLTDRELSNSRNMSKVIGQKINFRDKLKGKASVKDESDEEEEEDESGKVATLADFRNIEREKAIKSFLPSVVKEFKEEDLTIEEVYKKMDKFYAEEETDVRREDFKENLVTAFRAAYPELYEERIKREAAAEADEEDSPIIGGGSHMKKPKKKVDRSDLSKRGSRKIKDLGDWFKS